MNIHKTTKRIAAELDLYFDLANDIFDYDGYIVDIMDYRDECPEWELAAYIVNDDGSYTFFRCIDAPFKEELPATIRDEKHFREVVKFIGREMGRAL
jgi:hypothetical protein